MLSNWTAVNAIILVVAMAALSFQLGRIFTLKQLKWTLRKMARVAEDLDDQKQQVLRTLRAIQWLIEKDEEPSDLMK